MPRFCPLDEPGLNSSTSPSVLWYATKRSSEESSARPSGYDPEPKVAIVFDGDVCPFAYSSTVPSVPELKFATYTVPLRAVTTSIGEPAPVSVSDGEVFPRG